MLPTTAQENQIISQIMNIVFGADIAPSEIKGLQVHDETVVIVMPHALYSLGKAYFRQLVKQIKSEAAVAEVQAEVEEYLEQQATAIVTAGQAIEATVNLNVIRCDWVQSRTAQRKRQGWMARTSGAGKSRAKMGYYDAIAFAPPY